jgi:hypothetical protein
MRNSTPKASEILLPGLTDYAFLCRSAVARDTSATEANEIRLLAIEVAKVMR